MHKGRILVVDDDRLVLATLTHGLSQEGYEIIDADNGDDAILLAREHRPDLALLDIRMEGKSGFDVAAYLREYCQIPFMFLSAFADAETLAQVQALGAVDYLVKPLDIRQIVPAVEGAFARIGRGPSPLPIGTAAERAAVLGQDALSQTIAIAIGVLMQRHALPRGEAFAQLQGLATRHSRPLAQQAEQVLLAVESLNLPRG